MTYKQYKNVRFIFVWNYCCNPSLTMRKIAESIPIVPHTFLKVLNANKK